MIFRYWRWKRMARRAIAEGRTRSCSYCTDPIVPGDSVGRLFMADSLIHAGFHFTLSARSAFCETGAVAIGWWDGERVVGEHESLVAKAIRTGEVQVR